MHNENREMTKLVPTKFGIPRSAKYDHIANSIIDDIKSNHRNFLPGPRPQVRAIRENLSLPILADGLSAEQAFLILSVLPKNAAGVYLKPLRSGLSGASVFEIRCQLSGRRLTRRFVAKIGPAGKIEKEWRRANSYVCPFVDGVGTPIFRRGPTHGILVQDFVGLRAPIRTLGEYVTHTNEGHLAVRRLLRKRLARWYSPQKESHIRDFELGRLLARFLRKGPKEVRMPKHWSKLPVIVENETGYKWRRVRGAIARAKNMTIKSPVTISHGDLHVENVLVDGGAECWPIDFYHCRVRSSPIVDCAMLECSIKFSAMPHAAELHSLIRAELAMNAMPSRSVSMNGWPYGIEIKRATKAILEIRKFRW